MTPMEYNQKETDRQAGLFYRRQMDEARFGSPITLRPVETPLVRPHASLFGTKAERDAFADQKLAEERRNPITP